MPGSVADVRNGARLKKPPPASLPDSLCSPVEVSQGTPRKPQLYKGYLRGKDYDVVLAGLKRFLQETDAVDANGLLQVGGSVINWLTGEFVSESLRARFSRHQMGKLYRDLVADETIGAWKRGSRCLAWVTSRANQPAISEMIAEIEAAVQANTEVNARKSPRNRRPPQEVGTGLESAPAQPEPPTVAPEPASEPKPMSPIEAIEAVVAENALLKQANAGLLAENERLRAALARVVEDARSALND